MSGDASRARSVGPFVKIVALGDVAVGDRRVLLLGQLDLDLRLLGELLRRACRAFARRTRGSTGRPPRSCPSPEASSPPPWWWSVRALSVTEHRRLRARRAPATPHRRGERDDVTTCRARPPPQRGGRADGRARRVDVVDEDARAPARVRDRAAKAPRTFAPALARAAASACRSAARVRVEQRRERRAPSAPRARGRAPRPDGGRARAGASGRAGYR